MGPSFSRPPTNVKRIRVRVFGARMLPRLGKTDVLDPKITVQLFDGSSKSPKFVSDCVPDNGFNPNWEFSCDVPVTVSDMVVVVVSSE